MDRHAAHWQPLIDSGQMVFFGPVLDETGSWGLGIVEVENEDGLRAFAASDPVVTTGTGKVEVGKMLGGFVRPSPYSPAGVDYMVEPAPLEDTAMREPASRRG